MLAVLEPGGSIGPHAADRMTRVIALARRGQAQRVAACMFVRTPDLLVFDDLASALDVETERTLWERVFEAEAGLPGPACLVVSHRRAAQIILCARSFSANDDRIEAAGKLAELLKMSEEMQRLWQGKELLP